MPREGQVACKAKAVLSFLSQFQDLENWSDPGYEPVISTLAVKCSTESGS